jgi:hypothetical protein
VEAKAMPIAASARSHKIPPCIVPMGLACCGPDCKKPMACPSLIFFDVEPDQLCDGGFEASTFSISGCLVGDSTLRFSAIARRSKPASTAGRRYPPSRPAMMTG